MRFGLSIDYKKAPQHACYIIDNTEMPGFTKAQKQLLSALMLNQRDKLSLDLLTQQSAVSYPTALLLCRILRLTLILAIRRADNTIPEFTLQLNDKHSLELNLPEQWLSQHPLRSAALQQEQTLQKSVDLPLIINN